MKKRGGSAASPTRLPRLHCRERLSVGGVAVIDSGGAHYLRAVLRLGHGDRVRLFNAADGEWLASIEDLGRTKGTLRVERQLRKAAPSTIPDLWLLFAPIKKDAVDSIVEKATELGVRRLVPVFTRHTAAARINLERLRAHVLEAAEQTERLDVPELTDPVSLERLVDTWDAARTLIVCAESGEADPLGVVAGRLGGEPAAILIGPEGGFSSDELDRLRDLPSCHPVSLGPNVLRADTAAVAALAAWISHAGGWSARPRWPHPSVEDPS